MRSRRSSASPATDQHAGLSGARHAAMAQTPAAELDIEWLKAVVTQLRSIRSELNIAPSKAMPLLLEGGSRRRARGRLREAAR